MILEKIKKPNDIHKVSLEDFPRLAEEIRSFLIQSVSETGGHLASNLGVVELTLALHNVLDFPQDKLIWDVGHQAYTHKILTGRKDGFKDLRKEGGLSGFPKRNESDCDSFDTVPIPFPQDLVMSVPEICGERNTMWFLSSEMVRLPAEWHMKH